MTALVINSTQLPIQTVAPSIEIGEVMVSADKRTPKDGEKLPDAQRIRRVVLPSSCWQSFEATIDGSKSQGLTDILREALRGIASDRLRDTLAETPMQTIVEMKDYSISALLAWSEETASSRGSIPFTREQVEEWFKSSKTQQAAVARWTEAGKTPEQQRTMMDFLAKRFAALAAKNHGIKESTDADKLLSMVAPEDAETGTGADVVGRIAHISKTLAAKAAEENVSMDDL